MKRWIVAVALFATMFVLGFVLWPELQPAQQGPRSATADPNGTAKPRGSNQVRASSRARIPRVPRVVRNVATPEVASAASADADEPSIADGGVDPSIPLTAAGISSVADKMRPSIAACVEAWTTETPDIQGSVMLAFQIGPDGISDAWIMEHEQVPAGILGCFSSAVYEQRWPASPEGVEVTMPFEIDAGLKDDGAPTELLDRR